MHSEIYKNNDYEGLRTLEEIDVFFYKLARIPSISVYCHDDLFLYNYLLFKPLDSGRRMSNVLTAVRCDTK